MVVPYKFYLKVINFEVGVIFQLKTSHHHIKIGIIIAIP